MSFYSIWCDNTLLCHFTWIFAKRILFFQTLNLNKKCLHCKTQKLEILWFFLSHYEQVVTTVYEPSCSLNTFVCFTKKSKIQCCWMSFIIWLLGLIIETEPSSNVNMGVLCVQYVSKKVLHGLYDIDFPHFATGVMKTPQWKTSKKKKKKQRPCGLVWKMID